MRRDLDGNDERIINYATLRKAVWNDERILFIPSYE